eukprot:scaffold46953_cov62-Phaeocystis_antarctica.AAC.14
MRSRMRSVAAASATVMGFAAGRKMSPLASSSAVSMASKPTAAADADESDSSDSDEDSENSEDREPSSCIICQCSDG